MVEIQPKKTIASHCISGRLTQPQLNSKVGFDMKMTLDHHHHHQPLPQKLNVINISGVPDPILTKV